MKQGIHLGPPPPRSPAPAGATLFIASALALVLGWLYVSARTQSASLARDVERLEGVLSETSTRPTTPEIRLIAARLRLALDSGASRAVPPTTLLHLVESALPEGVQVTRISFGPSPGPALTLEASAASGDRVTELQKRLMASPLVATASLLEERRLPDRSLAIRAQVGIQGK